MTELTARQRAALHGRLRQDYQEAVAEVRAELQRHGLGRHAELAGQVYDAGDASVADVLADLEVEMAQRHTARLRSVENVFAAVRDGHDGYMRGLRKGDCVPALAGPAGGAAR